MARATPRRATRDQARERAAVSWPTTTYNVAGGPRPRRSFSACPEHTITPSSPHRAPLSSSTSRLTTFRTDASAPRCSPTPTPPERSCIVHSNLFLSISPLPESTIKLNKLMKSSTWITIVYIYIYICEDISGIACHTALHTYIRTYARMQNYYRFR
ncbi:uncharacterized protein LOC111026447 [Myzus persicae]|uniref:uncharacterized protein LOC111026447 n=1 Tax=Myzus persicae TaxID=13164 RepID=UPI000B930D03|nr:uncharacterized protein LOC111026447 [Myzus persicae]